MTKVTFGLASFVGSVRSLKLIFVRPTSLSTNGIKEREAISLARVGAVVELIVAIETKIS